MSPCRQLADESAALHFIRLGLSRCRSCSCRRRRRRMYSKQKNSSYSIGSHLNQLLLGGGLAAAGTGCSAGRRTSSRWRAARRTPSTGALLSQTATRDTSLCMLAGAGIPDSSPGPRRQNPKDWKWQGCVWPLPAAAADTAASCGGGPCTVAPPACPSLPAPQRGFSSLWGQTAIAGVKLHRGRLVWCWWFLSAVWSDFVCIRVAGMGGGAG